MPAAQGIQRTQDDPSQFGEHVYIRYRMERMGLVGCYSVPFEVHGGSAIAEPNQPKDRRTMHKIRTLKYFGSTSRLSPSRRKSSPRSFLMAGGEGTCDS